VNQAAITRSETSNERRKNEKPDPNQKQDPNHGIEDQFGNIVGESSDDAEASDDDKPPDDKNNGQSKEEEKKRKQKKRKKKKSNAQKKGGGSDSSTNSEESEKTNEEKKQSPDKKRKKKNRNKSSKKSSTEKPTPGVPLAAGLPTSDDDETEFRWPETRTNPTKGKRKQLKLPIGQKPSQKKDQSEPSPPPSGSDDEEDDDDDASPNWRDRRRATRKNLFDEFSSVKPRPKRKSKGSNLTNQKEVESFLQTLEWNDANKKIRAANYRKTIIDTVGSEGREGKTLANLKERKAAGKQEREERRLSEEATIGKIKKIRDDYLATVGTSGKTVKRTQLRLLAQLFPEADGTMDDDEKEEYNHYMELLPIKHSLRQKETDAMMTQMCSLQYIPKDPTPTTECPYGSVAYVKGKVKVRRKSAAGGKWAELVQHKPTTSGKWAEFLLPYPLTVEWVKFCFHKDFVSLLKEKPKQWQHVVVGAANKNKDKAAHWMLTKIPVAYPQGDKGRCLFLCVASAMHYMGLKDEAQQIAALSYQAETVPGAVGIDALRRNMLQYAPIIGRPIIYNHHRKRKSKQMTLA
jgi:hypothetical protein